MSDISATKKLGKPRVIIPLLSGSMVRMVVYSGVINRLIEKGARVVILSQYDASSTVFRSLPEETQYDRLPGWRYKLNRLWYKSYDYFFRTLLVRSSSTQAYEAWIRQTQPVRYRLIRLVEWLGPHWLLKVWILFRHLLLPTQNIEKFLDKYKPDLVLSETFGQHLEDYYLLRGARQKGIPSLCAIVSWDKLTTKAAVLERPDKLVVWNDFNKAEAINFHEFSPSDIYVSGVPHFDLYTKPELYPSRGEFCSAYGLDPQRKLVMVTPQPGYVCQHLNAVIQMLAHALAYDEFEIPSQVLIRPHPAVYFGDNAGFGTEEDLRQYEAMHPLIKGNRPKSSKDRIAASADQSDARILATALYHADVVVDFYGTIAIEACVLDTPVVYVDNHAFARQTSFEQTVASRADIDYSQYAHSQHAINLGVGRVVERSDQLVKVINNYLVDPSLDSGKRKNAAHQLCRADGQSVERLAEIIYCLALGEEPPQ